MDRDLAELVDMGTQSAQPSAQWKQTDPAKQLHRRLQNVLYCSETTTCGMRTLWNRSRLYSSAVVRRYVSCGLISRPALEVPPDTTPVCTRKSSIEYRFRLDLTWQDVRCS